MVEAKILEVGDLHLSFGGVKAIDGVSFEVNMEEIFSIIGPNGAGKTSVINCINGFYKPERGRIYFDGKDITKKKPHQIAKLGISRTFQGIEIYPSMTVLDNIMSGRHLKMSSNLLLCMLFMGPAKREEIHNREIVEEIIDFLHLQPYRKVPAGALPIGIQKRAALGRALALEPKLLLLDEPMAGMSIEEKEDLARYIIDSNEERRITVLLVEHDLSVVKDLSHRIIVMDYGKKIAEGSGDEVMKNKKVVKAYIGEA